MDHLHLEETSRRAHGRPYRDRQWSDHGRGYSGTCSLLASRAGMLGVPCSLRTSCTAFTVIRVWGTVVSMCYRDLIGVKDSSGSFIRLYGANVGKGFGSMVVVRGWGDCWGLNMLQEASMPLGVLCCTSECPQRTRCICGGSSPFMIGMASDSLVREPHALRSQSFEICVSVAMVVRMSEL